MYSFVSISNTLLEVRDDGRGFDPAEQFPGHLGLRSIRERVARLGGSCSIQSAPAHGTYLRVCIPAREEHGSPVEVGDRKM